MTSKANHIEAINSLNLFHTLRKKMKLQICNKIQKIEVLINFDVFWELEFLYIESEIGITIFNPLSTSVALIKKPVS